MTAEEKWDKLRAHVAARKLQLTRQRDREVEDYEYDRGESDGTISAFAEVMGLIRRFDKGEDVGV